MPRPPRLIPLDRAIPAEYPEYDHEHGHIPAPRRYNVYMLLDAGFVLVGLVLSAWLAWLYLLQGFSLTPVRLLYVVGFWLLFSYITLPRLHQVMTAVYLPDYFTGRTRTSEGVMSDPVNIALDGSERDLHVAMRRAGWVLAEERTVATAWEMVKATVLRRSYPAAPVSDLYLLGRRHDFCYQQEVAGSTSTRHHVRFWRVPDGFVLPGGARADWLAAGTYDRAVGFSAFTLQFTHRIDSNIDVERDFIVDTVRWADPDVQVHVIPEFSTAYWDRNGQGDRFITDGDLPVLDVSNAALRSDGATAVMLPHHRATGTTRLRGRAHAATQAALEAARRRARTIDPRASREAMRTQWHDAVDDLHDAVAVVGDHHLPPPTVILTGALVLAQALTLIARLIAQRTGWDLGRVIEQITLFVPSDGRLLLPIISTVAAVLLFIGVLRRNRWARLALLGVFVADAFVRLSQAQLSTAGAAHAALVAVGASSLCVMALSSEAARQWVQTERVNVGRSARIPGTTTLLQGDTSASETEARPES